MDEIESVTVREGIKSLAKIKPKNYIHFLKEEMKGYITRKSTKDETLELILAAFDSVREELQSELGKFFTRLADITINATASHTGTATLIRPRVVEFREKLSALLSKEDLNSLNPLIEEIMTPTENGIQQWREEVFIPYVESIEKEYECHTDFMAVLDPTLSRNETIKAVEPLFLEALEKLFNSCLQPLRDGLPEVGKKDVELEEMVIDLGQKCLKLVDTVKVLSDDLPKRDVLHSLANGLEREVCEIMSAPPETHRHILDIAIKEVMALAK